MNHLIALALLLYACGSEKSAPSSPSDHPARLAELLLKRDSYFQIADMRAQDSNGFIESDKCDSLLFSSLAGVGGLLVQIDAARDAEGRWHRTPGHDCYETGRSASTISKDMLMGLAWFCVYHGRIDILEQVLRYGRANAYVMGEGPFSRTLMTPSLQATFARGLAASGGPRFEPEWYYPQVWNSGNRGFTAHLQVLSILLHGRIDGGVSDEMRDRLKEHYEREPRNALYQFAFHAYSDGNLESAIELLLDDPVFPDFGPPTSADRCEPWIFQRDLNDAFAWEPCPEEGRTHSGADLIFLTRLIGDFYDVR